MRPRARVSDGRSVEAGEGFGGAHHQVCSTSFSLRAACRGAETLVESGATRATRVLDPVVGAGPANIELPPTVLSLVDPGRIWATAAS